VHPALPAAFGDEGAANHMRLAPAHHLPGVEIFVYGEEGGRFPARQNRRASEAVARRHMLDPARTLFVEQSRAAIDAGAFHNDVVAVSNGPVLLAHEQAFAAPEQLRADLDRLLPEAVWIEVPKADVPLADAITSYLFNSQLLTLPDGGMALVVPAECRTTPSVSRWLDALPGRGTPITRVHVVDVRESMRNGGGPACLRLRVAAAPHSVDPRFLLTPARADALEALIEAHWPVEIAAGDLGNPDLWHHARAARAALFGLLGL
jgi:succinylarginine dihydrolase